MSKKISKSESSGIKNIHTEMVNVDSSFQGYMADSDEVLFVSNILQLVFVILLVTFGYFPVDFPEVFFSAPIFIIFFLHFICRSEVMVSWFDSLHSKIITLILFGVIAYSLKIEASYVIGRIFGASSDLLPSTTYYLAAAQSLMILSSEWVLLFLFIIGFYIISLGKLKKRKRSILVGMTISFCVLITLSMNFDTKDDFSLSVSLLRIAYIGDFTGHHCKNISDDYRVLFTGDNNSVLVMTRTLSLGSATCEFYKNPVFGKDITDQGLIDQFMKSP